MNEAKNGYVSLEGAGIGGAAVQMQAKAVQHGPLETAQKALDEEVTHRKLADAQGLMMKMLAPHFTSTWEQLSSGLFQWFRHQGFWPKEYGPHIAQGGGAGDAFITLTRAEYTRLKKAEKIALLHSELSEMLEAVRKDDWANEAEEMADVQVRVLDYCGGFGVNLGRAFEQKMLANYKRPHRHGKGF